MRTICAVVLERNKGFLSFANLKKNNLKFIEEKEISIIAGQYFVKSLKANAETIEHSIIDFEKKHSLSVSKVFIGLPSGLAEEIEGQEKIVFSKKKKITPLVINSAKKYIENKFLEWDQSCLHNIILNYQTEGVNSNQAPFGIFTNKIKLDFLLIYLKDKLKKEVVDIFYNIERNFTGFVAHKIGVFFQGFSSLKKNQAVIQVNDLNSYVAFKDGRNKIFEKEFSFSSKEIIDKLSKQYSVSPALSAQLLERHGSFKTIPYFKEIIIKKEDSYLNLSTKAFNNFLKRIFSDNIKLMVAEILENAEEGKKDEVIFSFTGHLTIKDGFYGYTKSLLPQRVEVPDYKCKSSSFGCLKYGCFRPLEAICRKKQSLVGKIKKIYHEYF